MRRPILVIALFVLAAALILPQAVFAGGSWQAYNAEAFARAQKDGKTIFVSVHSDW